MLLRSTIPNTIPITILMHQPLGPSNRVTTAPFQELANVYESQRNREFYSTTARMMLEQAPGALTGVCLDVACGTGISTEVAIQCAPDACWHGLDASREMLAIAAAKPMLDKVQWVHSPAEATPLSEGAFDWILCNIAYHWLAPSVVEEFQRLLKPGGHLLLIAPLLPTAARHSGNRWIRSVLKRFPQYVEARRSQGLVMDGIRTELNPLELIRAQSIKHVERFRCADEMLNVLATRGSLHAIFGEHADDVHRLLADEPSLEQSLEFQWQFGQFVARKRV